MLFARRKPPVRFGWRLANSPGPSGGEHEVFASAPRPRAYSFVLASALALASGLYDTRTASAQAAKAADTDPPVIQHIPIVSTPPGNVSIDFTVSDESALFGVLFHWRFAGEPDYKQVEFPSTESTFHVALTGITKDFEFWIEAYDEYGNGPALDGTADRPNQVRVLQTAPEEPKEPPPETHAEVPPPPPPPPPRPTPPPEPAFPPGPFESDHVDRVQVARVIPGGRGEVSVAGAVFFGNNFIEPQTSMLGGSGQLNLTFAPTDWIQLHASTSFTGTQLSSTAANATTNYPLKGSSLDDWVLSARLAWPKLVGPMRFAIEPSLAIPANDWCAPNESMATTSKSPSTCAASQLTVSPGLKAMVSVETPWIRIHLNVGYLWDNSENLTFYKDAQGNLVGGRRTSFDTFALGISNYDDLSVGLGVEVPHGSFDPYVEWTLDIPLDRNAFATCSPIAASGTSRAQTCGPYPTEFPAAMYQIPDRLDLGLRYDINSLMRLDFGMEFSLTQAGNGLVLPSAGSNQKTALPQPADGEVLPPPYLFRVGFLWQFDILKQTPHAAPVAQTAPAHDSAPSDAHGSAPAAAGTTDVPPGTPPAPGDKP